MVKTRVFPWRSVRLPVPLVAGWLFDTLHRYDLAFWLCGGSFVLAALLLLGLPHPARQPGES